MEVLALSLNGDRLGLPDLVCAWGPPGPYSEEKGGVFAPEEVFFPTMLALLGYLRKDRAVSNGSATATATMAAAAEVRLQSVNYAEFVRRGDANPRSFDRLSAKLVDGFRSSGALFARKFRKGSVSLRDWRAVISDADLDLSLRRKGRSFSERDENEDGAFEGESRKRVASEKKPPPRG